VRRAPLHLPYPRPHNDYRQLRRRSHQHHRKRAPQPLSSDYTNPTSSLNLTNCLRRHLQPHQTRAPSKKQGRQGSLQNLVKLAPQPLERWRTPFEALKLALQSMNIERARRTASIIAESGAEAALERTGVISWTCISQTTPIPTMAPVRGKLLSMFLREMTFEKGLARCVRYVLSTGEPALHRQVRVRWAAIRTIRD
jgi:hypothetical protein